jgi:hypothetical protein
MQEIGHLRGRFPLRGDLRGFSDIYAGFAARGAASRRS